MVEIVAFLVFMRTRLNMQPYSPLKPTKVGFIFIGPNSLSRAKDLAAVNHVTQAVVRVEDWVLKVLGITAQAEVFKSRAKFTRGDQIIIW